MGRYRHGLRRAAGGERRAPSLSLVRDLSNLSSRHPIALGLACAAIGLIAAQFINRTSFSSEADDYFEDGVPIVVDGSGHDYDPDGEMGPARSFERAREYLA